MQFDYLVKMLEREREENSEFRDEVRQKLSDIEQWAAVHEERETSQRAQAAERTKHLTWLVGTIVTIIGIVLPIVLKVT